MLLDLAPEWATEIERGPDWLSSGCSRPHHGDTDEIPLAEMIWQKLEQAFATAWFSSSTTSASCEAG